LIIDRPSAARLGLTVGQIDNTLYDAFGQRQVSVIYKAQNQYRVVMEVAPEFRQSPEILNHVYISTGGAAVSGTQRTQPLPGTVAAKPSSSKNGNAAGDVARNAANNALTNSGRGVTSTGSAVSTTKETMVPLSAFTRFGAGSTPIAVYHDNLFAATTISFRLTPGVSLGEATAAVDDLIARLGVPASIHGSFEGTARAFQQSLADEPFLIGAALLAVYIVLGVLYESYVHSITILSTLPSAGVGAALALIATDTEFNLMALLSVILLIGIVKKNSIMMIDFALDAERSLGLTSREAIYQACLKRFRPIIMTTMAAIFGAVPLAMALAKVPNCAARLG
jgi:multidrug efflux pump